jgi:uncharacterized OB-fold protein
MNKRPLKKTKTENIKPVSQGWECPKCGSVYAIWVDECSTCKNSNVKIISTGGTGTAYGAGI